MDGIDPSEHKRIARASRAGAAANSFEVVALEWLANEPRQGTAPSLIPPAAEYSCALQSISS